MNGWAWGGGAVEAAADKSDLLLPAAFEFGVAPARDNAGLEIR